MTGRLKTDSKLYVQSMKRNIIIKVLLPLYILVERYLNDFVMLNRAKVRL